MWRAFVKSVVAATAIFLGVLARAASGQTFKVKPTRNQPTASTVRHQSGVEDAAAMSPAKMDNVDSRVHRQLHLAFFDDDDSTNNDGALDVNGSVSGEGKPLPE
eukprot:jgi/Undpi1/8423/HiC_scaffold_25.g10891.m1